jgi:hypothetical protein
MIKLQHLTSEQVLAWRQLIETEPIFPQRWTIIGGQLIYILGLKHGSNPLRVTDDLDVLINVRAKPWAFNRFIEKLTENGFSPDLPSADGYQHRWSKGLVQVDVVQPRWIGDRLRSVLKRGGVRNVEIPGAQQAIDRSSYEEFMLPDGTVGFISIPDLLGALVLKGAAFNDDRGKDRERHLEDFAFLLTLFRNPKELATIGCRDIQHLSAGFSGLRKRPGISNKYPGAKDAQDLLESTIAKKRREKELANNKRHERPEIDIERTRQRQKTKRCGFLMPIAKRKCSRQIGHSGAHR